jgi:hypothetical protein
MRSGVVQTNVLLQRTADHALIGTIAASFRSGDRDRSDHEGEFYQRRRRQ